MERLADVLDEDGALLLPLVDVEGAVAEAVRDLVQLAVLQGLPQVVGEVEQDALEKGDETLILLFC